MPSAYRTHDFAFDQGDVLRDVPFVVWDGGTPSVKHRPGIITAHGCVCERFDRALEKGNLIAVENLQIHVCPIAPAAKFSNGDLGNIVAGRVRQYYALPDCAGVPRMIVDFSVEQTIPARRLADLTRTTSLNEDEWLKLMVQHATYRLRKNPKEIFLPAMLEPDNPT